MILLLLLVKACTLLLLFLLLFWTRLSRTILVGAFPPRTSAVTPGTAMMGMAMVVVMGGPAAMFPIGTPLVALMMSRAVMVMMVVPTRTGAVVTRTALMVVSWAFMTVSRTFLVMMMTAWTPAVTGFPLG